MADQYVEVQTTARVKVSPQTLAEWFCGMDDESQAQFFIECAKIADEWERGQGLQWMFVSGHLRKCACSTYGAREMVRTLAYDIRDESECGPEQPINEG